MGRRTATVFGAGVTGLTAAHELAIRGFAVTVIDADYNDHVWEATLDWGVGGIARSQFFARDYDDHTPPTEDGDGQLTIPRLRPVAEFMRDDVLAFAPGGAAPASAAEAKAFIDKLRTLAGSQSSVMLVLRTRVDPSDELVKARWTWISEQVGSDVAKKLDYIVRTVELTACDADWVTVSPDIRIFAGEHGFRFFPSFYRHLFDTMKRTPVLHPHPSEVGIRTVYDNLVPVDELGFARAGKKKAFTLPRRPTLSFELVRRYLREIRTELGYTYEDLLRFELAMFKYMTSCTERRATQYEGMSWSQFLDLAKFSKIVQTHLEFGPQMALGLRGSKADARSQGNVVTQLLRDQILRDQHTDSLLDGPTSASWFNHWADYLCSQGVTFQRGRVTGFEPDGKNVVALVDSGGGPQRVASDYYVLAVALRDAVALSESLQRALEGAGVSLATDNDLARLRRFTGGAKTGDFAKADPDGPLQHLAGIQFFFDTELKFWRAHTQYLDSAWSLSSISQPQFWARARDITDNFRSIVSVDIGDWKREYTFTKPDGSTVEAGKAWDLSADEIATYVWAQVRDHHDDAFFARYGTRARFPEPIAYAIDGYISFGTPKTDRGGYIVPKTSAFSMRPGDLSNGSDRPKGQSSYRLLGNVALAGTYMKTFTRITTMESANESARHAVNAILDEAGVACDRCEIWDVEDNEFDDLAWFKELDERMMARRKPHFIDMLGWSALPEYLSPDLFSML